MENPPHYNFINSHFPVALPSPPPYSESSNVVIQINDQPIHRNTHLNDLRRFFLLLTFFVINITSIIYSCYLINNNISPTLKIIPSCIIACHLIYNFLFIFEK